MSNWQIELTQGIENFRRKFEDVDAHVENRPRIKQECDQVLARLREAETVVSAFVGVYLINIINSGCLPKMTSSLLRYIFQI